MSSMKLSLPPNARLELAMQEVVDVEEVQVAQGSVVDLLILG